MEKAQEIRKKIEKLFLALTSAKYPVVFTGAGISTLSGIKDFRGKDGLYKQPNSKKMFDVEIFYKNPEIYYRLAKDFIYGLEEKQPSIVHTVITKLQEKGFVKSIITQNIDLLHQKAQGKAVIELHGSPSVHYCIECNYTEEFKEVVKIVKTGGVPGCPKCKRPLKPGITFFGELLPQDALSQAINECSKADFLFVLGTSLIVYPAASLPVYTLRNGGKLAIINEQSTQYDSYADILLTDLEESFKILEEKIKNL